MGIGSLITRVSPFYIDGDGHVRLRDSSLLLKLIPSAGVGKVLTSDANGVGTWESPPSGTVPDSGVNALNILQGDGAGGWNVINGGITDPVTYTADHTITASQFGKTLRMNSATAKTFTFPSVAAGDDGARITLTKIGAGKVTFQAADSDKFMDSSDGGTMYNDTTETYARVDLEYCHETATWNITASGTWVTV